jgi:CheY-like chemotaxis protein
MATGFPVFVTITMLCRTMPSVLIVDDEKDARDVLSRFLQKAGFAVRAVPNGQQALVAIGIALPDVVLLDWMMPEMNGVNFLEVIRSYLRWQRLPVILITAYRGPHIDRAKELGVKCVFIKPDYSLAELMICIHRVVGDPDANCASAS